jgi:pyridoxamine 5'-phosphate oxidase family protein
MTNSILPQKEIEYLKSQRLARIATAAFPTHEERSVQPDVVPVGFDFDGE